MSYAIGVDSGGTHITATAYKNHIPIASAASGPGNILIDPNQTTKNQGFHGWPGLKLKCFHGLHSH